MLARRVDAMLRPGRWAITGFALILAGCGGGGGGGGFLPQNPTQVTINNISGDQSGAVRVDYTLADPDQNSVNVIVEFSTDGSTFTAATEQAGDPTTEGVSQLQTSSAGFPHVFVWDSSSDAPSRNTNLASVRVRVDENNAGPSATSNNFTLVNDPNETTPPGVQSTGATAVRNSGNDIISVTFNEEMRISSAQNASNFSLISAQDFCGNPIDLTGATFSYDIFTRKTHITLSGNLGFGTSFTIQVGSGVRDIAGNTLGSNVQRSGTVGGDDEGPELIDVLFVGSGVDDFTPDLGEFLDLTFDEDVTTDCGIIDFTDTDLVFFPQINTIGAGATIATTSNPRKLRIILGTGPSFTPGSSVMNIADAIDPPDTKYNDVFFDLAGNRPPTPGSPSLSELLPIRADDSSNPIVDVLTLEGVPSILNGTGSAGGTLQVPQNWFTIDLEYRDPGPARVDDSTIVIANDRTLVNNAGQDINAGTNLVSFLTGLQVDDEMASFQVPPNLVFPSGLNTLSVTVDDNSGNTSSTKSFSFQTVAISNGIQPFETNVNPSQIWFLDFNRDLDTLALSYQGGSDTITIQTSRTASSPVLAPNGAPDFDELLFIHGLNNDGSITFSVNGTGKQNNAFMRDWIISEIVDKLPEYFPGVNILFTSSPPGIFPGGAFQVGYNSASFSQITVSAYSGGTGALGVALVDSQNDNQDNNALFAGSSPDPGVDLGIFPGVLYDLEVNLSAGNFWRQTFDPFIPGRADPGAGPQLGPVGDQSNDKAILQDIAGTGAAVTDPDDVARRDAILLAVDRFSQLVAFVLAHECGHSMGLVENGAMPVGLYGNLTGSFPGSSDGHIDVTKCGAACTSLFPGNSVNVMIPAVSFEGSNQALSRFNPLTLAYFHERALYN